MLFKSGSVDKYKEVLLSAEHPTATFLLKYSSNSISDYMRQNMVQELKKQLGKEFKALPKYGATCTYCLKADTPGTKNLICPCQRAFYCSKECQRNHWDEHKIVCSRYQENLNSRETKSCDECGKEVTKGKIKNCPCKKAFYCSKGCQTASWKEHRKVCEWKLSQG